MPSMESRQYATQLRIVKISCVQALRLMLELVRADATCACSAYSKTYVTYHQEHLREHKWHTSVHICNRWPNVAYLMILRFSLLRSPPAACGVQCTAHRA